MILLSFNTFSFFWSYKTTYQRLNWFKTCLSSYLADPDLVVSELLNLEEINQELLNSLNVNVMVDI